MNLSKITICAAVSPLALAWLVGLSAMPAQAQVLRWKQIIGIIEAGNKVGTGAGQVVGGVQPWSTTRGEARVNLETGRLRFKVRGLVFAGGGAGAVVIGIPAPVDKVKGTLVCNSTGPGDSVLVDTPAVDLNAQGDAQFDGVVSIPAACTSEPDDIAFLVRVASPAPVVDKWIANGAVRTIKMMEN